MLKVSTLMSGFGARSDRTIFGITTVLLFQGEKNIIYDVGHLGSRHVLVSGLAAHGLTPDDIDMVVMSHLHWDHSLNIEPFKNAQILCARAEIEQARDPKTRDSATPGYIVPALESMNLVLVDHDMDLMEGVRLMVMPGHTAGFLAILATDDDGVRHVMAGDAIPHACNVTSGHHERGWFDQEMADANIKKLCTMGDIIYPGHDNAFRMENGVVKYVSPSSITIRCRFSLDGQYYSTKITSSFEQEPGWSK